MPSTRMLTAAALAFTFPAGFGGISFAAPTTPSPHQQSQPRDPRPGVARPPSTRELALQSATTSDPSNAANWFELSKLQQDRGATEDSLGSFRSGMTALEYAAAQHPTDPAREQLVATYYMEKAQKDSSLSQADKLAFLDAGLAASDRAIAQKEDYIDALVYKNILLRMKSNVETDASRRDALWPRPTSLRNRAMELQKTRAAAVPTSSPTAPTPPPPPPPPSAAGSELVDGQAPVRVGGNIKMPTKIANVSPVYPEEAKAAGVSGVVILETVIDTQGNVRTSKILRSIPALDQAAQDAVKEWRFEPTLLNGAPVPVIMTVTVNFSLQ